MKIRVTLSAALLMILVLAADISDVYSQSVSSLQDERLKSYKVVSPETYNRVLDAVFPRDHSAIFVIVLRFEPSFHPESQIVIKKGLDKAEVMEYISQSGNIYSKLNDAIARGSKEDAIEMAKLIKVRKRLIEVPEAQIKRWHDSFLVASSESLNYFKEKAEEYDTGTSTLTIDGTYYGIWYEQLGDKVSFRLYDQEVSPLEVTGDLKLVQWLNAMRREVEALSSGRREELNGKREVSRRPPASPASRRGRRSTKARAARKRKEREPETAARSDYR